MRTIAGLLFRMVLFWGLWAALALPLSTLMCSGAEPGEAATFVVMFMRMGLLFAAVVVSAYEWYALNGYLGRVSAELTSHGEPKPGRLDHFVLRAWPLVGLWVLWVVAFQLRELWSQLDFSCVGPVAAIPWTLVTALILALFLGRVSLTLAKRAARRLPKGSQPPVPVLFPVLTALWCGFALAVAFVRLPHMEWLRVGGYAMLIAMQVAVGGGSGPSDVELLVQLGPDDSISELSDELLLYGASAAPAVPSASRFSSGSLGRTWVVSVPRDRVVLAAFDFVTDTEDVDLVEFNSPLVADIETPWRSCEPSGRQLPVNDPYGQGALEGVGLGEGLRRLRQVRQPATLAVVDSGIAFHEDLSGLGGGGFDPNDHGTGVAGVAAALTNNGRGIASLNVGGSVIRLLDVDALAGRNPSADDVAEGIYHAASAGADVILVSSSGSGIAPRAVQYAIDRAHEKDAIVVVAAGNEATTGWLAWPANVPGVVAVGALSGSRPASFSNSPSLLSHGMWAPGVDLCVPTEDGRYSKRSGTSYAAPAVAGAIAAYRAACPHQGRDEVLRVVRESSGRGPDNLNSVLRVDALMSRAVSCR